MEKSREVKNATSRSFENGVITPPSGIPTHEYFRMFSAFELDRAVHVFLEPFVLTCCLGRRGMIVWLTSAADPSPSKQVDVAPSTGGVDPETLWI